MSDCEGLAKVVGRPGTFVPSLPSHDALADIAVVLLADPRSIENLFDLTRDIVFFVKNRRLRYVMVNETLVTRCGKRSKSDIIGRTAVELFPSPFGDIYTKQDRAVVEEGLEIHRCLEIHPFEGGRRGWCLTHKLPLRDAAGQVLGVVGTSRDLDQTDDETSYAKIAEATVYIQHHYTEPFRMAALVSLTGLSTSRLGRLFKRVFRLTPGQLLVRTRLDAAVRGLAGSGASVTDVALACGYTDHSAFTRQFKAAMGVTPSEFRRDISSRSLGGGRACAGVSL